MRLLVLAIAGFAVFVWIIGPAGSDRRTARATDASPTIADGRAAESTSARDAAPSRAARAPVWIRDEVPVAGPTMRGPKIGTRDDFNAAIAAADRGDAVAARELALTTRNCTTILYKFLDGPPSGYADPRLSEFAQYEASRHAFCKEIGTDVLDRRGQWMADAAKAGDRRAVLDLRFYPPLGKQAAEEREAWSALVVDLLSKAGDDPEALSALAQIHIDGVVVPRDIDMAERFLQRTMEIAPPESRQYKFAAGMRDRLRLIRSRKTSS
jgi:hypothetical protein